MEKILKEKQKRNNTNAILMDVSIAFDKVWHPRLIYKMIKAEIRTVLIKLSLFYLHGREFVVKINEATSEMEEIQAGMLQESLLGPILYNILTSNISKRKISTGSSKFDGSEL